MHSKKDLVERQEKTVQEQISELSRLNNNLQKEELERQEAEQISRGQVEALTRTLHALAQEPELDKFLGYVLTALTEQLGENSGTIWLYDDEFAATWLHTELHQGKLHRIPRPAPNKVNRRWDEEFLPRLRKREILIHTASEFFSHPAYATYQNYFTERNIQMILNIPLFFGDEFLGIFAIRSTCLRSYTPSELSLAQSLAHQATLAIQVSHLAEVAQQAARSRAQSAVLEERNRIAGEIHDGLAQAFTGIAVQLGVAERKIKMQDVGEAALHLQEARELAKEGLAEARRSVRNLRSPLLLYRNLSSAVSELARRVSASEASASLSIQFETVGEPRPLPAPTEDNLLRIAQEALNNALRHAEAEKITVTLQYQAALVLLLIKDDGKGFHPADISRQDGFGLQIMQERAHAIRGQMTITSSSEKGTRIEVAVPAGEEPGKDAR